MNQKDASPLKLYINQTLYGLGHCSLPANVLILIHLKRWKVSQLRTSLCGVLWLQ